MCYRLRAAPWRRRGGAGKNLVHLEALEAADVGNGGQARLLLGLEELETQGHVTLSAPRILGESLEPHHSPYVEGSKV